MTEEDGLDWYQENQNLGDICHMQKKLADAQNCYRQGIQYCQMLFREEEMRIFEWRVYYAIEEKLGEVCQEEGSFDKANVYFEESIRICRNLLLEYGQPLDRANLSNFYYVLGTFDDIL